MNRIDEMIARLCPDGVEYYTLCDVVKYEQPQRYIVNSTNYSHEHITPVLTAGQTFILGYTDEVEGVYQASKKSPVIIFDDFTTSFHWVDFPFKVKSSAMKIISLSLSGCNIADFRYIYYAMKCIKYVPAGHQRQWIPNYSQIKIPLPPLDIQRKIVCILDRFKELEAELEARKKQYEYYRSSLISNQNYIKLGEIALIEIGAHPRSKPQEKGPYMYINAGTSHSGFLEDYNSEGETITTPSRGQGGIGYIGYQKQRFWCGPLSYKIKSNCDKVTTKYLYYCLSKVTGEILKLKHTGSVPALNRKELQTLKIPIPPLDEQRRIVSILDKFNALVSDISCGIPAEIEARRKQYEYYRDKLLTFKEKEQ